MNIELERGDCLELMRYIPTESVDAIVTDPPYGIDYQSAWRTDRKNWHPKVKNDAKPFIWWLGEAFRTIKDGGCLLCFCRWDTEQVFKTAIEAAGFEIKSQVIWDRCHHGMGNLKSQFAPMHDIICFATKGRFMFPGKRPKSIIRSMRLSGDALQHPTEKPVDLMQQLCEAVTSQGQVILDPFMGSGTTGVACVNTGRNFIGIELDEGYFEIAKKRIRDAESNVRNTETDGEVQDSALSLDGNYAITAQMDKDAETNGLMVTDFQDTEGNPIAIASDAAQTITGAGAMAAVMAADIDDICAVYS